MMAPPLGTVRPFCKRAVAAVSGLRSHPCGTRQGQLTQSSGLAVQVTKEKQGRLLTKPAKMAKQDIALANVEEVLVISSLCYALCLTLDDICKEYQQIMIIYVAG